MDSERNMDEKASASTIQVPLETEESSLPGRMRERGDIPRVLIQGDIRLLVPESAAAHRPVRGHYHIETEGLREPLQVIWMLEGKVLKAASLSRFMWSVTMFVHLVPCSTLCNRETRFVV